MMVASAEEAVGLTELLYKFNALPTNPKVLFSRLQNAQRTFATVCLVRERTCHRPPGHM
jgi:hypothetical protein